MIGMFDLLEFNFPLEQRYTKLHRLQFVTIRYLHAYRNADQFLSTTLWQFHTASDNGHRNTAFILRTMVDLSMIMLVYQRVNTLTWINIPKKEGLLNGQRATLHSVVALFAPILTCGQKSE